MNILCDEGVDRHIVEQLRQDGHNVLYVAEMEPSITDDVVLRRANEHHALLVTEDSDFGELVYRRGLVHVGVVLVRLHGLSSITKARIVSATFAQHAVEMPASLYCNFTGDGQDKAQVGINQSPPKTATLSRTVGGNVGRYVGLPLHNV